MTDSEEMRITKKTTWEYSQKWDEGDKQIDTYRHSKFDVIQPELTMYKHERKNIA